MGKVCLLWLAGDPWRIKVSLVMLDSEKWPANRIGESLGGLYANQQRARQARSLSGGNAAESSGLNLRLVQRRARYRNDIPKMFTSSQLWHDPAVFRMQTDLLRNDVGEETSPVDYCCAGFVAGSFKGQNRHRQAYRATAILSPRAIRFSGKGVR